MNIFNQARLKLFGRYMLINLALLSVFTLVAFRAELLAFTRIETMLSDRVQRPTLSAVLEQRLLRFTADFRQRLLYMDIILLLVSTGASWFLSGITLKPIETMVKQQEEFSADASHELRTPLTSIIMEITALERTEKKIPLSVRRFLTRIKDECLKMKQLVDGLLTLVRPPESGFNEIFNLNQSVKTAFESLAKAAEEKKLNYSYQESSPLLIKGNKEAVNRLLVILIDNAIKFTNKGFVKITVSRSGHQALTEISDSGRGIPDREINRIFDRFYRVQDAIKLPGSGLGLAIAKKIAAEQMGKISVASQYGKGSVFTVSFPIVS